MPWQRRIQFSSTTPSSKPPSASSVTCIVLLSQTSHGKITFAPVALRCIFVLIDHRAADGTTLFITSSDGFCSTVSFAPTDLGEVYKGDISAHKRRQDNADAVASSSQNTPVPTPTSQFAPPSPFPNGSQHRHRDSTSSFAAPSPPPAAAFANQRPSSPTRSNSTSSIITQSSTAAPPGPPTLVAGSVPGLTATNSGKVTGVPIATPPETPRSTAGSVAGTKRDQSESEKEDSGSKPKKRRVAPTLVSGPGSDPKS